MSGDPSEKVSVLPQKAISESFFTAESYNDEMKLGLTESSASTKQTYSPFAEARAVLREELAPELVEFVMRVKGLAELLRISRAMIPVSSVEASSTKIISRLT